MKRLTFEVIRNESPRASDSLEAYLVRFVEGDKVREFIVPEYNSTLCEVENVLLKELKSLYKKYSIIEE